MWESDSSSPSTPTGLNLLKVLLLGWTWSRQLGLEITSACVGRIPLRDFKTIDLGERGSLKTLPLPIFLFAYFNNIIKFIRPNAQKMFWIPCHRNCFVLVFLVLVFLWFEKIIITINQFSRTVIPSDFGSSSLAILVGIYNWIFGVSALI